MPTSLHPVTGDALTRIYPDPDGIPYTALLTNRGPSSVYVGDYLEGPASPSGAT